MRAVWSMVLGVVAVMALALATQADDKKADDKKADDAKEVTLKGTITCAKCDLKVETKCATVIKVKDGDKDVVYYLDADAGKTNHKTICMDPKAGSVTGVVTEKDGKKTITASKVTFDK